MQRYFVAPESFREQSVTLEGEDVHHLLRVMRMKPGDKVIVSDGISREAVCVLRELEPSRAIADIEEGLPMAGEPRWKITVAQGLPKGDKMELVIQKGTEIGAVGFVPFQSERAVVQYDEKKEGKRLERWRKIAKEAAEQAHRSAIPEIRSVMNWRGLIADFAHYDAVFFCYEKEGGTPSAGLRAAIHEALAGKDANGPLTLLVVVGPEGGFAEREAAEAAAAGALLTGLGRRILRTETAAMAALACLMYESGEMGGH